jgi:hypothetical protein
MLITNLFWKFDQVLWKKLKNAYILITNLFLKFDQVLVFCKRLEEPS